MDSDDDVAEPDFVESNDCESNFFENSEERDVVEISIQAGDHTNLDIFSDVDTSNKSTNTPTEDDKILHRRQPRETRDN